VWFVGGAFVGLGNNTYQLVINTGTTIITFLMVFIIQNTQNRDGSAVQAKRPSKPGGTVLPATLRGHTTCRLP